MKPQYQDRRFKPLHTQNQLQLEPQKCPRCDSLNTKFCYYNNYSLSQPRYLCKTCRRYWTQGGTLRNVPVGGSCRKSRPAKQSPSSGENSGSQLPPTSAASKISTTAPQHVIFSGTPVMTAPAYFSSGDELGSSSRWVNSFGSPGQCQIQSSEVYQMIEQSRNAVVPSSHPPWPESFIGNPNSMRPAVGDTTLWTSGNNDVVSGINPSNNTETTSNSLLNPSQWPDYMPGFCAPP